MRGFFLCAALVLAAASAQAVEAADPMEDFDATILRSFTIQKCHASQDKADQEVMARVSAVRQAALDQLWARFDKADPTHHEENGKAARETLDRRSEAHDRFIQSQVIEYGCEWLDGKFRPSDP
jgi:hypothetical protein